ncbi:MAG: hypothetical protein J6U96_04810, partial [Elusimicrobiaceae bacterium]|nr:hypothetical protein [Elusimicrobiaceae bacterium]
MQNLFAEVWRSYYPNKSKEVLDFMSMEAMPVFKMAGLTSAEQEREMAGYLRGIIKQDGVACEGVKKLIPSKKATEQASGRCARALSAILPLGIVGQEANGSDRADAALISDLMQRSEQAIAGTEVFMAGVSALIGLKGDKELATILVYAPIPVRWRQSYEKEALNWISDGMFHPITKTVQIAAANVHDEWEYDSFAQNIENSFYDENSAKPGNIFYDLGAFLTEQSAKDAAAKSVLEKVMRTNLKYSWDTASRNQDIYPSMPFKMFMMGALSKGYRVSINVGDHFRTGKPKITDAYGVTWDAAQFKKWHEADAYRMANWACGRSGNLHTPNGISQTGFVLSGLLTKLDKDTSLPPGVYKWVKTELTNAYNKELRACDAAFKSSAQAGDEKYAVLHKTGSQAKLPGDADVQAYSAKYDASQAKLKRADRWGAGARWTAFAIDMALLLWLVWDIVIVGLRGIVTSGRSVYLVVKDARAMQGTARVRSLLRSQRLARYGTSSGWKVFKGKTNFNLAKLKLDLTPDSLLSVAQKEAMQSMRGSYAAYLRTSSAAASGKAPATLPEVFPQSQWERAAALTKQELPLVSEIPAKIRSRASARADFADKNMLYELGPAVSEKRAADQKALIDRHRSNGTLIERDGYLYAAKGQKLPSSLVPVEQGLLAKPVDPAIQQARLAKEAQVRANFAAKNDLYELGRKIQVKDDPAVIWHRNTGSLVEHEGYLYGRKDVMAQMPKVLTEDLEAAKVIQQTTLDKVTLGRASKFKNLVHKTKMAVSTFLTSAMLVTASPAAQAHLASPVQTEMVAAVAATPVEASPIILDPAVAEKGRAGALIMGGRSSTVASVEQIAEKLAVQRLAQPEQFKAFQLFMENKQAMQLARNAVVLNGMREGVSPFWNKYQLAMYDFSHPFEGVRQKIAESRLSNNVFYQEYLRTVQAEEELAAQREAEARELERQARQMEGQLRPAYASGYLYSGLPVQKIVESTAANTRARTILSAPTPLLTDLRSILNGQASVTYKKRALLSLYRQGALDKTIRNFSKDVKEKLDRAELESRYTDSTDKLENVLFNLWNLGFFTKAINGLRNLAMGESSQLLQSITADESFAVESRAIYDQTPVLSPQSALFAGVVSSLKGVDKALVLAGTRENGFALKNAGNGTTKGGYVYYANNIPVYFRNVQGNISAQPVAILTQPQSTWFAKALSRVGLSSPLGVRVPKGMVLAIDETGKWKFVRMPGFEEDIQQSKPSRKIQAEIYEKGSAPKALDTPYSTTDMLAIAKMLDADPNINFQLLLNPSSSFQQFINAMALGIGLNADGVLTGPLKRTVNSTAGAEGISGIGYVTPWIAGWALPRMTNWGIGKSLAVILSVSTAALAVSWGLLGFNGQVVLDAAGHAIPYSLAKLAVPMVVMVLGASLMRTIKSLVLNYNKDPQTRTRAFLRFSSFQQASRAAL